MFKYRSRLFAGVLILLIVSSLYGCNGDYRLEAQGPEDQILVVMDSTQWKGQTADAIRSVFGGYITTLPNAERRYTLNFVSLKDNDVLNFAKKQKNVIFAAPIDGKSNTAKFIRSLLSKNVQARVRSRDNFVFPLKNLWYRNQWTLILTSTSDDTLAKYIHESEPRLLSDIGSVMRRRYTEDIYDRGEQKNLEKKIWDEHGFKIRVEHDYQISADTTHFLSMQFYMPTNDRWIWFWWKDNVSNIDFLGSQWANATRDSLMKIYVRGTRDSSYVTTEYRRDVITKSIMLNGYYTLKTNGTWRMTNDAMGGPFVSYVIYVPEQERLYMMDFSQFAPKYPKKRFVRQFEAMAYTFRADTTLTPAKLKQMEQKQYEELLKKKENKKKKNKKASK